MAPLAEAAEWQTQSHLEPPVALHVTVFTHEMGLVDTVFSLEFVTICWGIFLLLSSS